MSAVRADIEIAKASGRLDGFVRAGELRVEKAEAALSAKGPYLELRVERG
jgi:hypothetical protein